MSPSTDEDETASSDSHEHDDEDEDDSDPTVQRERIRRNHVWAIISLLEEQAKGPYHLMVSYDDNDWEPSRCWQKLIRWRHAQLFNSLLDLLCYFVTVLRRLEIGFHIDTLSNLGFLPWLSVTGSTERLTQPPSLIPHNTVYMESLIFSFQKLVFLLFLING